MKKILAVLGMAICMIGLTACGQTDSTPVMSEKNAVYTAENEVVAINSIVDQKAEKQYKKDTVTTNAIDNWKTAVETCGQPSKITDVKSDINSETAVVYMTISCATRTMKVTVTMDSDGEVTQFVANPVYSQAENMERAGLNTLIGMGMAFAVLIIISLVISLLPAISKLVEGNKKKPAGSESDVAMDNTIAQIEKNEEQTNDTELVAVIAAAVAAAEGTGADGFVVRSIRRR